MRLMHSSVQRVCSSIFAAPHILPFSSFGTCPDTKMKSPARTAGWNGRFGFFLPMAMILSLAMSPSGPRSKHRRLDDIDAALPIDQIADSAVVDGDIIG